MTTISGHLDSVASAAAKSRLPAVVLSKRLQLTFLYSADFIVIAIALFIAVVTRGLLPFPGQPDTEQIMRTTGPLIAVAWLVMLRVFSADALRHLRAGVTEYKRVIMASSAMAATVGITCYLLKFDFPRAAFVLMFAFGTLGLLAARWSRRKVMGAIHSRGALTTPLLVAGDSGHVDAIAKVLRRESWLGYRVIGAITSDRVRYTPAGLPVLGALTNTVEVIEEHEASAVIFAEGSFASPAEFRRMAWQLEEHDIQMIVVPAITDTSAQRLEVRPVAGLPLVDVERPQALASLRWIKRTADAIGAALLLLAAAPVMALVALAIKLEDGGPVLFKQTRVGRKGELFECLKFRSMAMDAEERLAELQHLNEAAGPLFKMTDDPRITRVGRFIRRFSIDELPQFWNALVGDMSLVGPRPALPDEVARYDFDARRRLDARPGLTGLWQVSGRSDLSWEDSVRLDIYYVDNWSVVQDLMILAKTARAVLLPSGAY
ncbi:MAG: sugar transferase [Actinobacteria bacterium]|uniref:sugar transferase n=1 Tax=Propionicimonas sp. TaxID=1955623 RepID=UPI001851CE79|nr:sugar transferase [Propionicimonas sp.]MBU3978040.1 sugar transferase [Actinomycetota bacterium]MBA3021974.1 sugar transferase [Propionicimonas sp.]MBU3985518.1 sugar transferase [Actinomycetota bacterium]MBU4007681.1 sugar transferase [Actinomycetota bacterium]MBU4064456.1 sugar transferase [Actinomycetota bacterium]